MYSLNLSISRHDQDHKVNTIQQSDLTTFDHRGKSIKKSLGNELGRTILRSKVHLATITSRVWPVTFLNIY